MKTFTDQMGRSVRLTTDGPPQRIISLVPSQTEFLHDIGLGERVVGITKFCIHPTAWFQEKRKVGGTKTLSFERIEALKPDLIIGNKEENERDQIEALATRWPVWMSDILTLDDALDMMRGLGELVEKESESHVFTEKIGENFSFLKPSKPLKTAYFIWRKPFMVAASGTFVDDLMRRAGFENAFSSRNRYPEITLDELAAARPAVILLSSEPFPFQEKHVREFRAACPDSLIRVVDGEMFSWYGSRLVQSASYLATLRAEIETYFL